MKCLANYVKEVLKLKKRENQKANNKIAYRDKVTDKEITRKSSKYDVS